MSMLITHYPSLAAFTKKAAGSPRMTEVNPYNGYYGGVGNTTYKRAVELAVSGDDSLVPRAVAIFDLIDSAVETPCATWQASPYGAFPSVPEFLAGSPDCMRKLSPAMSSTAPIGVYVGTDPSSGVTEADIMNRGVAILALVMKLQAIRPITLTLLSENVSVYGGDYTISVDLNCQPLDLATTCYALTNVAFVRHLLFGMVSSNGHRVAWPYRWCGGGAGWEAIIRESFHLGPQDLYIRAAHLDDRQQFEAPIEWVNDHVRRFIAMDGEL